MHELIERELYEALEYARSVDEEQGKHILIQFEIDQPMFSQTLFSIFPTIIDNQSNELKYQNLAQYFADLCFDVLCVYQQSFGKMPRTFEQDSTWMESQAMLLDKELAPLLASSHVNEKAAKKMKEDAHARIEQELKGASDQLKAQVVQLSVQMAEEILKRSIGYH